MCLGLEATSPDSQAAELRKCSKTRNPKQALYQHLLGISKTQAELNQHLLGISKSQAELNQHLLGISKSQAELTLLLLGIAKSKADLNMHLLGFSNPTHVLFQSLFGMFRFATFVLSEGHVCMSSPRACYCWWDARLATIFVMAQGLE